MTRGTVQDTRRCYDVEATHQRGFFTVHVQVRTHGTLGEALATLLTWQQEGWDRVALMPRSEACRPCTTRS
jgi:hypothetical protein